jgi:hypothetical protein
MGLFSHCSGKQCPKMTCMPWIHELAGQAMLQDVIEVGIQELAVRACARDRRVRRSSEP